MKRKFSTMVDSWNKWRDANPEGSLCAECFEAGYEAALRDVIETAKKYGGSDVEFDVNAYLEEAGKEH